MNMTPINEWANDAPQPDVSGERDGRSSFDRDSKVSSVKEHFPPQPLVRCNLTFYARERER